VRAKIQTMERQLFKDGPGKPGFGLEAVPVEI
jgi:hypothetical protein